MPDAAGRSRQARRQVVARRAGAWLAWWFFLMILWTILDDSIGRDELLAGAGAAALAALLAEAAAWQASVRFRARASWLASALSLPARVAQDTVTVTAALARRILRGEEPPSCFVAEPVRYGPVRDGTAGGEDSMRRALIIGARSLAPNSFALGIDPERGVMISHKLVPGEQEARTWPDS